MVKRHADECNYLDLKGGQYFCVGTLNCLKHGCCPPGTYETQLYRKQFKKQEQEHCSRPYFVRYFSTEMTNPSYITHLDHAVRTIIRWKGRLKLIFWMDETVAEELTNGPSGPRRGCAVQAFSPQVKTLAEGRPCRPEH